MVDKPVKGAWPESFKVPIKPKKEHSPKANGGDQSNDKHAHDERDADHASAKRLRPDDSEELFSAKKARMTPAAVTAADDDIVIVGDTVGGAIVIDDD